jgi:hypothetical protein
MFRTELGFSHVRWALTGASVVAEAAVSRLVAVARQPAGGEQLAEFDSEFLRAGDTECLERVRGRPIAVRGARRWYGRRRANGS